METKTCRWPGCDRPAHCRGLCTRDYQRAKSVGGWEEPWDKWTEQQPQRETECRWPECGRTTATHRIVLGYCDRDRWRAKTSGGGDRPWEKYYRDDRKSYMHLPEDAECLWPECTSRPISNHLCQRDYARARAVGTFTEPWIEWERQGRKTMSKYYGWSDPCRWPGCKTEDIHSYGLCPTHRTRAKRVGDFETPWITWEEQGHTAKSAYYASGAPCRWPECVTTEITGHGMCATHHARGVRMGNLVDPWLTYGFCVCEHCGTEFYSECRHNQRFCTELCRARGYREANRERIREAGMRREAAKNGAKISKVDVLALKESTEHCYLCGLDIDFTLPGIDTYGPQLDHIHPLAQGGPHCIENVAYTHNWCNNLKRARTPAQLHEYLRSLVAYMFI